MEAHGSMRHLIAAIGGVAVMLLAFPVSAQFAPGSFGDAVNRQMCNAGEEANCPPAQQPPAPSEAPAAPPPDVSKLAPNSPETSTLAKSCEQGQAAQCRYFAQVLDQYIRAYAERRRMHRCSDPAGRQPPCEQLDALSKDVVALIAPAGKGYARACQASVNVACIEGARLELAVGQPGATERALNLLFAGCSRDDIANCREIDGLRGRIQLDAESTRLAAGKLCVLSAEPLACYNFGQGLESGIGGPVNLPAARDAYARGCAGPGGNADSCWSYAGMLRIGRGGPVDLAAARDTYLKFCQLKQTKRCVAAEEIKP